MLVCTALVLLMSVPALALFYGGLVRTKNMLSRADAGVRRVLADHRAVVPLRLQFRVHRRQRILRRHEPRVPRRHRSIRSRASGRSQRRSRKARRCTRLVFVAFQATFAAITCCLILGSIVERIKFSAVLIFVVIWFTFSYVPIAHMVWFWPGPDAYTDASRTDAVNASGGFIWQMGALDFAGGTVVHINAGIAGLVGAFLVGKRVGYGTRSDQAAQPDDDDDRRVAAVVRLVRLQRRLGARGERRRRRSRSSTRISRPRARCCRGHSPSG